jgi:hypothetical protein
MNTIFNVALEYTINNIQENQEVTDFSQIN